MIRRTFLQVMSSLPLLGWLAPQPELTPLVEMSEHEWSGPLETDAPDGACCCNCGSVAELNLADVYTATGAWITSCIACGESLGALSAGQSMTCECGVVCTMTEDAVMWHYPQSEP